MGRVSCFFWVYKIRAPIYTYVLRIQGQNMFGLYIYISTKSEFVCDWDNHFNNHTNNHNLPSLCFRLMLVFPVVSKSNIRFTGYLNELLWNLSKIKNQRTRLCFSKSKISTFTLIFPWCVLYPLILFDNFYHFYFVLKWEENLQKRV